MLLFDKERINYNYSCCQQCGACEAVCPKSAITMELLTDGTHRVIINDEKCIRCKRCVNVCPANKEEIYDNYFNEFKSKKYFLGYNANDEIRRASSSGGCCKTTIIESLRSGFSDGVYSLKQTGEYPFAEGEFYTRNNIPQYDDIPNSIYHSVMACRNVNKIQPCKRLLVIGTSCQLRAINTQLKDKADEVVRICIFCKQQKTLDSTRFLAKVMGTRLLGNMKKVPHYRGEGWPGIVRVNESGLPYSRAAQIPFGRRLWSVSGCDVCGDSFGIHAEADLTLMDPWEIRKPNNLGETLVVVHTALGGKLLKECNALILEPKTYSEVKPALSLKDVWRKQVTEPVFRGNVCDKLYVRAVHAELKQRKWLRIIVEKLPRLPVVFYRIFAKLPDLRNCILK